MVAFGDYLHFTIAELTPEQIADFLPRWCRASVRRESAGGGQSEQEREEMIDREARQMAERLSAAVEAHPGVRQLAENPLLLVLLAVMHQNSIELPKQRVELYTVVTRTLLENRNLIKNIKPIPEAKAIQRLGPIAYTMQKSGNSFARQRDVKEELKKIIPSSLICSSHRSSHSPACSPLASSNQFQVSPSQPTSTSLTSRSRRSPFWASAVPLDCCFQKYVNISKTIQSNSANWPSTRSSLER